MNDKPPTGSAMSNHGFEETPGPGAGGRGNSPDPDAAQDRELGEALHRALRRLPETSWGPPPVTLIEERAAARARARAVRRTLAGVAASAVLIVGGVVSWNALGNDGAGTVVVSSADPDLASTDPAADPSNPDGPASTDPAADPSNPDGPASTDPASVAALHWVEIDPGTAELVELESVGDGRIIARTFDGTDGLAPRVVVTADGTDWTELAMPAGIVPRQIDISGDRWVVAGHDVGAEPHRGPPDRVFFSDNEGAYWTELILDIPANPPPVSPYVREVAITWALVSGQNMVVVVGLGESLDIYPLLEGRGLVPEGKSATGWGTSFAGSITFDLVDSGPDSAQSDSDSIEGLTLTYEELGLTDEERTAFESRTGRMLVLFSDGAEVAEVVAEDEARGFYPVATAEGFALGLLSWPQETVLISPDGRVWRDQPSLGPGRWIAATDGSLWRAGLDDLGRFGVWRADFGETPVTVATFEDLDHDGELALGPAGMIVTAVTRTPEAGHATADRPQEATGAFTVEQYEAPERWVGWSPDGTAWSWTPVSDVFGVADTELWPEFAVGDDFVLARVETGEPSQFLGRPEGRTPVLTIEHPDTVNSASVRSEAGTSVSAEPPFVRWFIAEVP